MRIKLLLCCAICLPSLTVLATEQGGSNYLPGFYGDFAMAVMPDKGTYFNNFITAYQDSKAKTGTLIELPSVVQVTDYRVLGGQYIFGIYPGVTISKDLSASRLAAADAYIMPIAIHWHWSGFDSFAYEGIIAPMGYYEKNALSTTRNIWTFDHILSLTKPLAFDNEVSVTFGIMNNTINPATHYQSGNEFHFDYTFGHYFTPEFGLGVAGSVYQQISKDQAPAAILSRQFSQAGSIGPVIMYTPRLFNRDITLSIKWLHELYAENRLTQDYLVCRLFMPF